MKWSHSPGSNPAHVHDNAADVRLGPLTDRPGGAGDYLGPCTLTRDEYLELRDEATRNKDVDYSGLSA